MGVKWGFLRALLFAMLMGTAASKRVRKRKEFRRDRDRPNNPTFKEITGAFVIEVDARIDKLNNGKNRWWWWSTSQKVFDFGNGKGIDNIYLGQEGRGNIMAFAVYKGRTEHKLLVSNCIVPGEVATWTVGVDEDGLMWIEKNGVRLGQKQGAVPNDVTRVHKRLGRSSWSGDTPLDGAVLGLRINHAGDKLKDYDFVNLPGQLNGGFIVSLYGRFDRSSQHFEQKLLDFSTEQSSDYVSFGQFKSSKHLIMEVNKDGQVYQLLARNAIDPGVMAFWRCGVEDDGTMFIEKNGVRLASGNGSVPKRIFRKKNRIGRSHSGSDDPIDGVILGLRVELSLVS